MPATNLCSVEFYGPVSAWRDAQVKKAAEDQVVVPGPPEPLWECVNKRGGDHNTSMRITISASLPHRHYR